MKLGALLSSLMPYSIALSIVWTVFVIIWFLLGIPVGPGGPYLLNNSIQRDKLKMPLYKI
ncbi:AbgT family transporter [Staphylococcus aureus]